MHPVTGDRLIYFLQIGLGEIGDDNRKMKCYTARATFFFFFLERAFISNFYLSYLQYQAVTE